MNAKHLFRALVFFTAASVMIPFSKVQAAERTAALADYGMLPVYGQDIKDGTYPVNIRCSKDLFPVQDAQLNVSKGSLNAEITFFSADCRMLYQGTSIEAANAETAGEEASLIQIDRKGLCTLPVQALDRELTFSGYLKSEKKWEDFSLLFEASSLPEDALLVTLPDYEKINAALTAYSEAAGEETPDPALTPFDPIALDMKDGEYSIGLDAVGGSGKSTITSPALLVIKDGKAYTQLEWSSANYDYMIVGGETYYPINEEGNSIFEVPISVLDIPMPVIADTTAMGTPHEISYALTFYSESIGSKGQMPREAAKRVLIIAFVIITGGGILSRFSRKRRMQ